MAAHFQNEDRQGQNQSEPEPLAQGFVGLLGPFKLVVCGGGFGQAGGIAGFAYSLDQVGSFYALHDLDVGFGGSQIDRGFLHTGHFQQGFFNPTYARGAGHVLHIQNDVLLGNFVTTLFHCLHNGVDRGGTLEVYGGLVGGQIDLGRLHAWHLANNFFNPTDAGGARHAFHV